MITDYGEIAEVFGKYFNSITQLIKVPDYQPPDDKYTLLNDPIVKAIEKYKQHPSILKIKDSIKLLTQGLISVIFLQGKHTVQFSHARKIKHLPTYQ